MPDARFFETLSPLTVADLASVVGGDLLSDDQRMVASVAPLAQAGPDAVGYVSDRKYVAEALSSRAGVIIAPAAIAEGLGNGGAAIIVSPEPQAAWARAASRLYRPRQSDATPGVHPGARIEQDVLIGPGVVIGDGAEIGAGTRIGANTVVGPGVAIGRDGEIGSNVSIHFALIGDRVRILSGARIGEQGFGAAPSRSGPVDVPQLGRVILQDNVMIGANSCVDRGGYGDTVIGENTKIDNLVMIGHNVRMGRNCLAAAFVGISGSVVVGDNVIFGGRAGVGDHQQIGDAARIAAGAGILSHVPAGETWSGYPARPLRQFLRETIWLAKQAARKKGDPHE